MGDQDILIVQTWNKLSKAFEIDIPLEETDEEQQMIEFIAERVRSLLRGNLELLMSHLYRLDVDERKVNNLLYNEMSEPVHVGIAKLIWERQKMRIQTKASIKQDPIEGWDDF